MNTAISIHWFRRDLRLHDNAALHQALKSGHAVLPIFIFDTNILDKLEDKSDKRLQFIHNTLTDLDKELQALGSGLLVKYGSPIEVWKQLLKEYNIKTVFTNRDYEPYAQERDKAVYQLLNEAEIPFKGAKDHVIFEKNEVLKKDGKPYTIFTPYSKVWKKTLTDADLKTYSNKELYPHFINIPAFPIPSLAEMGFNMIDFDCPPTIPPIEIIKTYDQTRNFPAIKGTSRLGIHLRFGTISVRELAQKAIKLNETYLNELIWRDFYHAILYHFPHVVGSAFKPQYDAIPWRNNEREFQAWCEGKTGYPIVDAGMRELNETGYMHNRVRMITASFLTKHLLIDWRWGEAYFAKKLLDFDLAANNGGWQWAASTGCDAAPYFRIFNPTAQTTKFDKEWKYIRQWIPEIDLPTYPEPIVDHKMARQRAIDTYKTTLNKNK